MIGPAIRAATLSLLAISAAQGQVDTDRPESRGLPLPKEDDVFHFVIFGDRTGGPADGVKILAQAVVDTNLLDPDLVMTVGDLVQGYNQTPEWLEQMEEFRSIMSGLRMPWFPVAGNHDIYWRGPDKPPEEHEKNYETHFGPLWYSFRHKNAGFIVLYSDEADPRTGERKFGTTDRMSDAQFKWLDATLERLRDVDHVFVFLHHPRWVERWYPKSDWDRAHRSFAAHGGVRAVFAGHIHRMRYDGRKDGIEYFSLATTGGSMPGTYPSVGYIHHMNVVTVRKDGYAVSAIPVGAVFDPRQFTPERQDEVDALRRLALTRIHGVEIGASGEANGSFGFTIENPTSRPIEIDAVPEFDARTWLFDPEHRHLRLAPGQRASVSFAIARRAAGFDAEYSKFTVPAVRVDIDYLEDAARVHVPPKSVDVPVRPAAIAEDFFVPGDASFLIDGAGSAIRIDPGDVQVPDGPITVEARIRAARFGPRQLVLSKLESSEYGIELAGGRPRFLVHLAGAYVSVTGPDALAIDTWHHIAGVFDGSELRLYVDGKLAAQASGSGARTSNRLPLFIGADTNGQGQPIDHFAGRIDEVRISAVARYAGDSVSPSLCHEPDDATLLLLHGDRDLGPFAIDHSPRAAHGRLLGSAKSSSE